MAAKGTAGVKAARGVLYVLLCIVAVIIVVGLVILAYNTAMNTMTVNMLTKDAFTKRAQAVLLPSADGSDRIMLERLFAPKVISTDEMLNSRYYENFEISNYYERADVEFHIVWPWDDSVTLNVTEIVRDINGKRMVEVADGEEVTMTEVDEKPLPWKNGVYSVTLKKDPVTGSWRVNELGLIEPLLIVDDPEPTLAAQDQAAQTAAAQTDAAQAGSAVPTSPLQ